MSRNTIISCTVLIILTRFLFAVVKGEIEILECIIKGGDDEIHLKFKKTRHLLFNEHLPVWTTTSPIKLGPITHTLHHNFIKENIGKTILFHDKEKSSAVVYFEKTQQIYGIVDTRYVIDNSPIDMCKKGLPIGKPYIKTFDDKHFYDHTKPLDLSIHGKKDSVTNHDESSSISDHNTPSTSRTSTSNVEEPPRKRFRNDMACNNNQKSITLYPEILIFIPYEITKLAKERMKAEYLVSIVKDHIIYFNAIDMLYSKLSTNDIKIYINIAGIVIDETKMIPLEKSRMPRPPPPFPQNIDPIDSELTLHLMQTYMQSHKELFVPDSFDFYFISTITPLQPVNGKFIDGISKTFEIFPSRVNGLANFHSLGTLVVRGYPYSHVIATHEIAHLMHIEHDPYHEGFYNKFVQCNSIMQPKGSCCPDCLKWTDRSVEYLRTFVRYNRNHCYLLNTPRSLHPYGIPIRNLSPSDQCRCYGFKPQVSTKSKNYDEMISENECNRQLICVDAWDKNYMPLPLDGTPCGNDKVCWNTTCQDIPCAE